MHGRGPPGSFLFLVTFCTEMCLQVFVGLARAALGHFAVSDLITTACSALPHRPVRQRICHFFSERGHCFHRQVMDALWY
jgi:hypothetical protein